ncbi:MAG: DUF4241 domain-containing protein [Bacilli bacterium]|nr:DUF4241 domain-containing protein [Bacilli bacterium]
MKTRKVELGIINVGNSIMVSDPCYGVCSINNKLIDNISDGRFNAFVRLGMVNGWSERVKELTICKVGRKAFTALKHLDELGCVSVDSGVCGIYDSSYFNEFHDESRANDDWYKDNVLNGFHDSLEEAYITKSKGIHSCSGYGDGVYPIYIKKDENDKIFQITIRFI